LIRSILIALLAFLLSGCVANPPLPSRPSLAAINAFAFSGRVSVRQDESRHHASIDWRHTSAKDEILLTTPLGQGLAEITRDADGARLLLADGRRFAAADWSALSEEIFGFRLPLKTSARWLLGMTGDTEGWRIAVVERESAAPDALPAVIELERDDIAVRLKIDAWSDIE